MSIKDTAQSIIKSINDGDTLTSVSLNAENFHADTVKLVSVLAVSYTHLTLPTICSV